MLLRIGHRGAAGYEPENTLKAISKAIALGADLVEVDVQRTSDGHLVIIHDKRVDRTTDGTGYVSAMTLAEVRNLDAGEGQPVPTLTEVLALTQRRVGLILEIITEGIAEQVCAQVREYRFNSPLIYASFLHAELLKVRAAEPLAKTMTLLEGVPITPTSFAMEAKASVVGLASDSLTASFINALHSAGLQIFVYTVNDPLDIRWVKSLEVDGIISDFPDRI
jgi:glycerophosphoryl diester phosphodiesterase